MSDSSDYSESDSEPLALVLDNGSHSIKFGFSGDDAPRCVFPNLVGRFRNHPVVPGVERRRCCIEDEAQQKKGMMRLSYPMECGVVVNWDDMEKVWHHMFYNEMKVSPEEHPVILTEAPLGPTPNREKMAQIMYETFDVPSLYVALQGVLSMYSSGTTTGMILDCGDTVSHTIPIHRGYALTHAIKRLDIGGRDLTHYMATLLRNRGFSFSTVSEIEIVRDIKDEFSYVANHFEEEQRRSKRRPSKVEYEYKLPDGNHIVIGEERFSCPEVLFQPSLVGMKYPGLHSLVNDSITECDQDVQTDLYENIVVSGGSTLIPGFSYRLREELKVLSPEDTRVVVVAPPERKYSVWIGGSILSSLSSFQEMWITKKEYEEFGPDIVVQKCF